MLDGDLRGFDCGASGEGWSFLSVLYEEIPCVTFGCVCIGVSKDWIPSVDVVGKDLIVEDGF